MAWYKWNGEICQLCGRAYKMGYGIKDEIWNKVVKGRWNLLCLDCFDELAHQMDIDYSDGLVLHWAGKQNAITDVRV